MLIFEVHMHGTTAPEEQTLLYGPASRSHFREVIRQLMCRVSLLQQGAPVEHGLGARLLRGRKLLAASAPQPLRSCKVWSATINAVASTPIQPALQQATCLHHAACGSARVHMSASRAATCSAAGV